MADEREGRLRRAASFGVVADAYERARPGYPDDAVRWLAGDEPCDVVDLGAGTGKLTRSLVALGHRVTAVEPLEEMLEQLRRAVPGATAVSGSAEAIPLPDGLSDVVTCAQAFHWFDQAVALPEIARVLRPGGRIAIATEDPESFERVWFTPFFPSVPAIDGARFPARETLTDELTAAGFGAVEIEPLRQHRVLTREKAIDIIRSKAFSTFDLLPREEYSEGLARAEAELPASFEYQFVWLLAGASR